MALKVLEITATAALVIIVLFLIPIMLRLSKTLKHADKMMQETRPGAVTVLKKAGETVDTVNKQLETIEDITTDTEQLLGKAKASAAALEKALTSPMAKAGAAAAGATATGFAVKKRISKKLKGR